MKARCRHRITCTAQPGVAAVALVGALYGCDDDTSCIAQGTGVLGPDGLRPIEDIRVGDAVYSVDVVEGRLAIVRVTAVRSATRECVRLRFDGPSELRCTSDHPLYDPDEHRYRPAADWLTGAATRVQVVARDVLEPTLVTDSDVYAGTGRVYDLTVSGSHHNFVAEGVVVHNKSYGRYGIPGDPAASISCPEPLPDDAGCLRLTPVDGADAHEYLLEDAGSDRIADGTGAISLGYVARGPGEPLVALEISEPTPNGACELVGGLFVFDSVYSLHLERDEGTCRFTAMPLPEGGYEVAGRFEFSREDDAGQRVTVSIETLNTTVY